ncbi:MAG TPA: hypothetical protein VFM36_06225 [Thermoanaerobaculia bacterium]|nr:hypothetical protein [Thermoanaerobaculia bacterium]
MHKKLGLLILILALSMALAACGRDETAEPPASTVTTEQAGTSSPSDIAPTTAQSWIDDVTIGSELGPDGSMVAGKTGDDFAPGQTVHLTMEVGDAPPNSQVKVVWYGPNETKIGEETKPVVAGQKYLSFSSQNTASWTKGDYRAEVWIGDEKVNQQQFNITDASKAAA